MQTEAVNNDSELLKKLNQTKVQCPKCNSSDLLRLYFRSPQETWAALYGRAGWLFMCKKCNIQIGFYLRELN